MSSIDPPEEDVLETYERSTFTKIDGKKVAWDRIHEPTGRNRKNVETERFVRKRGFDCLGTLLQGSIKKHGLGARIEKSMVLDFFTKEVKSRIPRNMHHRFRALHITHGVLTIACLSSGVAFTIRRYERELLMLLKDAGVEIESMKTILSTWR